MGHDYALMNSRDKCYLVDHRISEQWLRIYGSAYIDEDKCYSNEDLSENDFIKAVLYPETVKISKSNYQALAAIALRGKCAVLSHRLEEFCAVRLADLYRREERDLYTTADDFRVLKKTALVLNELHEDFLQRLWDRWVVEAGSEPPSQYSHGEQGKLMAGLFSATPLTVNKLTERVLQVLGSESCPFKNLALLASKELLGEMPEAGKLFAVRNFILPFAANADELNEFLQCMPCLRAVRMQLAACAKHQALEKALSHLNFLEGLDLTIHNRVSEEYTDVLCKNILYWPIKDLSITASAENAHAISRKLPEVISNLAFLEKFSIRGMDIPRLAGLDRLEIMRIQDTPESAENLQRLGALRDEAPRLRQLDLNGKVYAGKALMEFLQDCAMPCASASSDK
jgi:hypothetical protein